MSQGQQRLGQMASIAARQPTDHGGERQQSNAQQRQCDCYHQIVSSIHDKVDFTRNLRKVRGNQQEEGRMPLWEIAAFDLSLRSGGSGS
jgi:hypothetical protein